ncbi:MARVEL domain-containing protein 3 isoform X1 [Ursus americanus]|uniref:MARVEL domain-containing protein 3 isoform X1 n=1 Tax=Ursus maritimus TaxID=29073 RepID=A0A384D106_URSMA|nr:MARVEL domain-containing protein 3 isoform X1 [Ursus maritimus]XP_026350949.1 MARVEL domain-containing protein 3 isoform X1 [Ursus arctos]XP_045666257.1 MARVEL domain-containing protein 3 isoform X1 [Ursus americanus]
MEGTSGSREPRARPRERDPDRHPRPDRDRHTERQRDRPGDRRRERNGGERRDGDRDRGRDRDPRQDRHRIGDLRAGEQRVWEKSGQSRTREGPRRPTWDAAPPPWPAPWETPQPPPQKKERFGPRGQASEPTSGRYLPSNPRSGLEEVEYYQSEAEGLLECHKCKYLCTGRGVVQIVEVILNGMVLMCVVASYFVLAGFTASFTSGGGFGNNYYSPFEGTELEQVRQLDQKYTVLRAPLIYGGVAVSLGLGVLTMSVLLQGAKSLTELSGKWLLLEAAFSLLAALSYGVGIGIYLHVALQINSTDTCRARASLYARKGLTWMNCQLAGTDGAAATFACLLVVMYGASVVLALRSYREQKHYKDSQAQHSSYSDAPQYLWSGTL